MCLLSKRGAEELTPKRLVLNGGRDGTGGLSTDGRGRAPARQFCNAASLPPLHHRVADARKNNTMSDLEMDARRMMPSLFFSYTSLHCYSRPSFHRVQPHDICKMICFSRPPRHHSDSDVTKGCGTPALAALTIARWMPPTQ